MTYVYKDKLYMVFSIAKMKVNQEWLKAIVYYSMQKPSEMYVREAEDFYAKFVKVEDR